MGLIQWSKSTRTLPWTNMIHKGGTRIGANICNGIEWRCHRIEDRIDHFTCTTTISATDSTTATTSTVPVWCVMFILDGESHSVEECEFVNRCFNWIFYITMIYSNNNNKQKEQEQIEDYDDDVRWTSGWKLIHKIGSMCLRVHIHSLLVCVCMCVFNK